MEELLAILNQTEKNFKSLKTSFDETKKESAPSVENTPMRSSSKKGAPLNLDTAYSKVKKSAPTPVFPKAARFKEPNTLTKGSVMSDFNESVDSVSTASSVSLDAVKQRPPIAVFSRSQRFSDKKIIDERTATNPNYELVKPKAPVAVIKSPEKTCKLKKKKKPDITKTSKSPIRSTNYQQPASVEPTNSNNNGHDIAAARDFLEDSDEDNEEVDKLGPGAYNVNYEAVEFRKSTSFNKSSRFNKEKTIDQTPLNPNIDAVRKSISSVKIAKETPINEKLKKKKDETNANLERAAEYQRNQRVDSISAILPNTPAVKYVDPNKKLNEKQAMFRIFELLQKRREMRKLGPALYSVKYGDEEPVCMVLYRKSLSPRATSPPERLPGPGKYYAKDDLIRENAPKFSFKREPKTKKLTIEEIDMKTPLDVKLDLVKPRLPAAVVLPEHKTTEHAELYEVKLGPGAYDQNYDLVERRTDIGVLEFKDLTEKNTREYQMNLAKKDVFDGDLNPNYDYDKPNKLVPVYHEPVKLDGPAYPPESKLHPEQWKFYDANLDAIKPDVPDALIAGGLQQDEYIIKERDANDLINYLRRKRKQPEIGQYDIKFNVIDPEKKAPDFERYLERDIEDPAKIKGEIEMDGDVLILDPKLPEAHLANIKFDQMVGRVDNEKNLEFQEELILNPKYDQVDKKVVNLVNIAKQPERKTIFDNEVNEFDEKIVLNVNYGAVDPKIKGIPDFKRLPARDDLNQIKPYSEEEVILNPTHDVIKPDHTKTAVRMDKGELRFKETPKEEVFDGRPTTELVIDYNKALDAIKPDPKIIDFNRYAPRKDRNSSPNKIKPPLNDKESKKFDALSNMAIAQSIDLGPLEETKGDIPIENQKFTRYDSNNGAINNTEPQNRNTLTNFKKETKKPPKVVIKSLGNTKRKNILEPKKSTQKNEDLGPWAEENNPVDNLE